ncbi:hypothetical protein [Clostridium saccharoperbutylacetonicum]|uniref:hypothetical protein n=1 Tax=Clostridium saccharoperbutylacetonicum TaxID=36745 RepID=UPI00098484DF|nr:hypothetical protein [Clostridium saccharoperbutylacetonicum]
MQDMLNQEKGIISIASTYCIGSYFMPLIISGFLNQNPDTKFQFNRESIPDILRDLKDGKITLDFYINCNFCVIGMMSRPLKCYYGKIPN